MYSRINASFKIALGIDYKISKVVFILFFCSIGCDNLEYMLLKSIFP